MRDVEAGAGTVGKLVVAVDGGDGVLFHQVMHQLEEGETLGFGAGVGGMSVGIEAADISDANALGVVTWAMGTDLFDGTASVDAAIGVDDVMIADVVPAEGTVVSPYGFHRTDGIGARGGAVDDGVNGLNGRNKGEQADCPRCGRLAWLGIRRRRGRGC